MGFFNKVSGAWKPIIGTYIKIGGVWKLLSGIQIKVGGVWKLVFPHTPVTYTWTGAGDAVSWSDTINWDVGGSYPSKPWHNVVIDAGNDAISLNAAASVDAIRDLTIADGSGGSNLTLTKNLSVVGDCIFGDALFGNTGRIYINGKTLTVYGNITLQTGGIITLGSSTGLLKVGGNFTRTGGIFTHSNGTIEFFGSFLSSIPPTGVLIYNFKCIEPGKEIKFTNGQTIHIDGKLEIQGAPGLEIKLHSTTPGSIWGIQNDGNIETVDYASVKDSDPVLGNDITATHSINEGNNDDTTSPKWIFV